MQQGYTVCLKLNRRASDRFHYNEGVKTGIHAVANIIKHIREWPKHRPYLTMTRTHGKRNSLQIKESKTKRMIFNPNRKKLNRHCVENNALENVTNYKYLGLTLTASGSFMTAKHELKSVPLKSFYSLRNSMTRHPTHAPSIRHIKPILTYCCKIRGLDGK